MTSTSEAATDSPSLDALVRGIEQLKPEISHHDKLAKELRAQKKDLEWRTIETLRALGLKGASVAGRTIAESERTNFKVEDPDAFLSWVEANNAWYCVKPAVEPDAIREHLAEHGELPPGVIISSFTQLANVAAAKRKS